MPRRIPEWFIDELIGRVDIVGVVESHVPLRRAGKDFKGLCPFHEERTPSFTVSPEKQFYHCFGCGAHGTAIGFIMQLLNLDFPEAVTELAGRAGMEIPEEETAGPDAGIQRQLYAINEDAARFYAQQLRSHSAAAQAVAYLKGRGVSGEMAREFGIGYAPPGWNSLALALGGDAARNDMLVQAGLAIRKSGDQIYDRFRERIMLPIHDARGRVVGFGGRVLNQEEPKYLNSPETPVFHKGRELYHLHRARQATRDARRILVVEGYLDVIALVQHGVRNVVATLGTATTRDHLDRLFRVCGEISFCFDGDIAGKRAAWRALATSLPLLQAGRYVSFLFLPAGDDPDTLVRKQGPAWFEDDASFQPLADVLFHHLQQEINVGSLDGRAKFMDRARPLIEQVPQGTYRRLLEQRLAETVRLPEPDVEALLANDRARSKRPFVAPAINEGRPGPSLIRTSISHLLRQPGLAPSLGDAAWIRHLPLAGSEVLADLLDLIAKHPQLSGAALVERFRGSATGEHLARLLALEPTTPPDGVAHELHAAIERLREIERRAGGMPTQNDPPSKLSEQDKQAYRRHIEDLAKRS